METITERQILIILLGVLSVCTLFCLLGLVVPAWAGYSLFEWKNATSTVALCIISLLLLIGCVILVVVLLFNLMQNAHLPLALLVLLIVTSLFLLGTFTSFVSSQKNHSFNLIVTSFTFTYLSSIVATYWLFGARQGGGGATGAPNKQPRLDVS